MRAAMVNGGMFQLTAARRRLAIKRAGIVCAHLFQLTAARRRLGRAHQVRITH